MNRLDAVTADQDIKYDRRLLGVEHPMGTFQVTREMIVGFARATGETDHRFFERGQNTDLGSDRLIAPPTFCNLFMSDAGHPDIKMEFGDATLFAGQAVDCLAPVYAGDEIRGITKLKDVYSKTGRSGKMVFTVWESSFTNQRGETVCRVQESFVRRNRNG